ncbi:hypothetical protein FB451DRAFT_1189235 [Mycena latifolia]|nr:hypothetical protein FB451DRAFT_1189235 [Mycena latifolia]
MRLRWLLLCSFKMPVASSTLFSALPAEVCARIFRESLGGSPAMGFRKFLGRRINPRAASSQWNRFLLDLAGYWSDIVVSCYFPLEAVTLALARLKSVALRVYITAGEFEEHPTHAALFARMLQALRPHFHRITFIYAETYCSPALSVLHRYCRSTAAPTLSKFILRNRRMSALNRFLTPLAPALSWFSDNPSPIQELHLACAAIPFVSTTYHSLRVLRLFRSDHIIGMNFEDYRIAISSSANLAELVLIDVICINLTADEQRPLIVSSSITSLHIRFHSDPYNRDTERHYVNADRSLGWLASHFDFPNLGVLHLHVGWDGDVEAVIGCARLFSSVVDLKVSERQPQASSSSRLWSLFPSVNALDLSKTSALLLTRLTDKALSSIDEGTVLLPSLTSLSLGYSSAQAARDFIAMRREAPFPLAIWRLTLKAGGFAGPVTAAEQNCRDWLISHCQLEEISPNLHCAIGLLLTRMFMWDPDDIVPSSDPEELEELALHAASRMQQSQTGKPNLETVVLSTPETSVKPWTVHIDLVPDEMLRAVIRIVIRDVDPLRRAEYVYVCQDIPRLVCRRWERIIMNDVVCWSYIRIHDKLRPEIIRSRLGRSGAAPLSLTFSFGLHSFPRNPRQRPAVAQERIHHLSTFLTGVFAFLTPEFHRCFELKVFTRDALTLSFLTRRLAPMTAPMLTSFQLNASAREVETRSWQDITGEGLFISTPFAGALPRLRYCHMDSIMISWTSSYMFSNLAVLVIGQPRSGPLYNFLCHGSPNEFTSVFRATPRLRELRLFNVVFDLNPPSAVGIAPLISLTHLEIDYIDESSCLLVSNLYLPALHTARIATTKPQSLQFFVDHCSHVIRRAITVDIIAPWTDGRPIVSFLRLATHLERLRLDRGRRLVLNGIGSTLYKMATSHPGLCPSLRLLCLTEGLTADETTDLFERRPFGTFAVDLVVIHYITARIQQTARTPYILFSPQSVTNPSHGVWLVPDSSIIF